MREPVFSPPGTLPRVALVSAAVVTSLGSFALLLRAFDQASPSRWLVPTPELVQLVSTCDAFPDRSARDACARQVVAALLERQQRELLLAQR